MNIYIYDQTFEGLVTAIHNAIELKMIPDKIVCANLFQNDLFANQYFIDTNDELFDRFWNQIKKKTSKQTCQQIYMAFLSELPGIEMLIFNYVKLILDSPYHVEIDLTNEKVVKLINIAKKVSREVQRTMMFIRFQKTIDNIYYASFEPKYNVVPLSIKHFKDRYANQKWVIFDTKRKYGYYYDLKNVSEITISNKKIDFTTGNINAEVLNTGEKLFQELWVSYYKAINIQERKNLKVHTQFLPKRFWKFLPEKSFKTQNINA